MANIVFRVDSSDQMGIGHAMRCLTLAKEFKKRNHRTFFVCKDYSGNITFYLEQEGMEVVTLSGFSSKKIDVHDYSSWIQEDWKDDALSMKKSLEELSITPDVFVIDHYGIECAYEEYLANEHGAKIVIVDDLVNRKHFCDLLIDQTLGRRSEDYTPFLSKNSNVLVGIQYALLREEVIALRERALEKRKNSQTPQNLLVALGGARNGELVEEILKELEENFSSLSVTVVCPDPIESRGYKVMSFADNMEELMIQSDIAIGAAGGMSWERCALGLPTLAIQTAANQKHIYQQLGQDKIQLNIGTKDHLDKEKLRLFLERLKEDRKAYCEMVENCFNLCDGKGTKRVADELEKLL